jgi:hypothetical protein
VADVDRFVEVWGSIYGRSHARRPASVSAAAAAAR